MRLSQAVQNRSTRFETACNHGVHQITNWIRFGVVILLHWISIENPWVAATQDYESCLWVIASCYHEWFGLANKKLSSRIEAAFEFSWCDFREPKYLVFRASNLRWICPIFSSNGWEVCSSGTWSFSGQLVCSRMLRLPGLSCRRSMANDARSCLILKVWCHAYWAQKPPFSINLPGSSGPFGLWDLETLDR